MIDIKQYLEQTNTVLLTKDAFEYLKERASVPDKVKAEYDPSADLISREKTLTAFADYVGSGMSMDDYDALWDIVAKMPAVNPQPSGNAIDRAEAIKIASGYCHHANVAKELAKLPAVNPQTCGDAIDRKLVCAFIDGLISDDREREKGLEYIRNMPPVNPQPCEDAISRQAVIDLAKKGILVSNGNYESVCKAINELPSVKPQPCEDAISRQAVQDYIAKYLSQYLYDDVREAVEVIDEYIGELPPVNPTKNIVNNGTMNITL